MVSVGCASSAAPAGAPATPLEPIPSILHAFEQYSVVALGEGNHGNEQGHAFRLALVRDPRFVAAVNDIVVEFGNARYQSLMDHFLEGGEVPDTELQKVWQNTTQFHPVWDPPIYEEFFRAVRDVNRSRPPGNRLRILLGDAPVDWDHITTLEDYRRQPQRSDVAVAALIQRESIDRNRRALVIYGDMHFLRKPLVYQSGQSRTAEGSSDADDDPSIVAALERLGTKVFSIRTEVSADLRSLQPDIAKWAPPRLALLRGTPLGLSRFDFYYPFPTVSTLENGAVVRVYVDGDRSPIMQEQYDAVLYLGPPGAITYSLPAPRLCADESYLAMRFHRMQMGGWGAQVGAAKQYCASVSSAR